MTPTSIIEALTAPLSLTPNARCERWGGGDVNSVFVLRDGERHFAVKWSARGAFSGVNKQAQFALQATLSAKSIAPKPVFLSKDEHLWVETWEGESDSSHQRSRTDAVDRLASALAVIHSTSVNAAPLHIAKRMAFYINQARLAADHPLTKEANQLIRTLNLDVAANKNWVLCHNDLSLPHIVSFSHRPMIVDWEYAAMGDRYFDVASCAHINQLSDTDMNALFIGYAKAINHSEEEVIRRCHQQMLVVKVTSALWYEALAKEQSDDDPQKYGVAQ